MVTEAQKQDFVKGQSRSILTNAVRALRQQGELGMEVKPGCGEVANRERCSYLEIEIGKVLDRAIFSDDIDLGKVPPVSGISRSLLQAAIDSITFDDFNALMKTVKGNPCRIARLLLDLKNGLEFINQLAVFYDDEVE